MAEQQACEGSHSEEKNSKDEKEKLLTEENKLNYDGKEDMGNVTVDASFKHLVVLISFFKIQSFEECALKNPVKQSVFGSHVNIFFFYISVPFSLVLWD